MVWWNGVGSVGEAGAVVAAIVVVLILLLLLRLWLRLLLQLLLQLQLQLLLLQLLLLLLLLLPVLVSSTTTSATSTCVGGRGGGVGARGTDAYIKSIIFDRIWISFQSLLWVFWLFTVTREEGRNLAESNLLDANTRFRIHLAWIWDSKIM